MAYDETQIDRKETAVRILLSVLFLVVAEVVEVVLWAVIVFELAFALITQRPPSRRVRQFANRTLSYLYHLLRYLTYNELEQPFPFTDFPSEVEPVVSLHESSE